MTKLMLLAAAATLSTGAAFAASNTVAGHGVAHAIAAPKGSTIVNQTSGGTGVGIVSQNFNSSVSQYDSYGADAFTIKKSATVTGVVAGGVYFNGSGPATSEDVIFYSDSKGTPGKALKGGTFNNVKGKDASGTFTITLKKGLKLKKGTYWVSVVANLGGVGNGGEWGWTDATETGPYQADWENPSNVFGTGCTTWGKELTCVPAGQANGKNYQLLGKGK